MLRKTTIFLSLLSVVNSAPLYAMNGEREDTRNGKAVQRTPSPLVKSKESDGNAEEKYIVYITKSSFVTSSTIALVRWSEGWFVDKAMDIIGKSLKSSNFLLDWTLTSAIRGMTIQEALPIAQERGKIFGIVVAGIAAPIVWDGSGAVMRSSHKVFRHIFEDNVPAEQRPTKRDYFKVSLGTTVVGSICYTLYKSFSH